jgi:FkbM family methyltransferase
MLGQAQRGGLWLFRRARQLGLLSNPIVRRVFNRAYFAYKRHFEDPFHELTMRHPQLFRSGDVLDIGANIGYTAIEFARAVDRNCRVYAFEPASENFASLEAAVAAAGLQQTVIPVRAAVGDAVGEADLALNEYHPGDHRVQTGRPSLADRLPSERVPLTTVDAAADRWGIDRVAFIKIDVQGYELRVCRGMTSVLAANPGVAVALEYDPGALRAAGDDPNALLSFFADLQYIAYRLERRGGLVRVDAGSLDSTTWTSGYVDLLFTRLEL